VAVNNELITDRFAAYHGDSCEVLPTLPDACLDLSIYSPPFAKREGGALYHYSSSPRDLSNARSFNEFAEHYAFIVGELTRLTKPGRMTAVHCADVPTGNTGRDGIFDLPGEIIRLHERMGWVHTARYTIWKEPLGVRVRTMAKNLAHKTITEDATFAGNAGADYVLMFRRAGENAVPVAHAHGLTTYAGSRKIPAELARYKGWKGKQTENRYSHWIWRQYASCIWDDIRIDNVLPFHEARDEDDEKHVHPLQLDVIERVVQLYSLPGERVLTPFMGVGSEVFGSVRAGRLGVGIELKASYFRQALKNLAEAERFAVDGDTQLALFDAPAERDAATDTDAETMDPPDEEASAIEALRDADAQRRRAAVRGSADGEAHAVEAQPAAKGWPAKGITSAGHWGSKDGLVWQRVNDGELIVSPGHFLAGYIVSTPDEARRAMKESRPRARKRSAATVTTTPAEGSEVG